MQCIACFVQKAYNIIVSERKEWFLWQIKQRTLVFEWTVMNITTAFNIFVRQTLREGKIPFDISLNNPNKQTIAAMIEAERIATDPSVKGYTDVDELLADLKK